MTSYLCLVCAAVSVPALRNQMAGSDRTHYLRQIREHAGEGVTFTVPGMKPDPDAYGSPCGGCGHTSSSDRWAAVKSA